MHTNHSSPHALKAAASALLAATLLTATTAGAEPQNNDWHFSVDAYAWLPSIEGESNLQRPGGGGSGVSVDTSEILDSLDAVFMGGFSAGKNRWGVTADLLFLDLQDSKTGSRSLSFTDYEVPGELDLKADLEITGWAITAVGSYAVVQSESSYLEIVGGARYLELEQKLKWNLSGNIADSDLTPRSGKGSLEEDVLDAVVGVRGQAQLGSGNWFVPYYLDIGTGGSDFTWQAMAGVGYSFSHFEVVGAYRYLEWDFGSDNPVADLSFSGVLIGARYRW